MPRRLSLCLTGRTSIIAICALLTLLMLQGAWDILEDLGNMATHQHAMEEILEGLGTILVALGVALEERETLLKFLGVYPQGLTPAQERIDHHCHGYGLVLLLVGLFVEVSVYLIRMPDLNTADFDPALIVLGAALSLLGGVFLARLAWLLWRDKPLSGPAHG